VIKAYGMTIEKEKPRCPHCAWELEYESDVVCLHCGYNLMTRERLQQRILEPHTGGDYFLWWLPAVLCLLLALGTVFGVVAAWLWLDFGFGYPWDFALNVYISVMGAGIVYFTGKFALKRMIFHPTPPEREKLTDVNVEQAGDQAPIRRRPPDDDDEDDDDDDDDDYDDDE
jgi:hypothetical protein